MSGAPRLAPRRRRPSRLAVLGAVLLAAATTAGCATRGLAFRVDDRIDIVAPDDNDEVTLPVTLEWTARDYDGRFGVFVDRSAPPPGKPLSWIARGDDECENTPGCPDEAYFAQRGAYATDGHSLVIERVLNQRQDGRRCSTHEATVVLLDEDDRRRGESAWAVTFRVCEPE